MTEENRVSLEIRFLAGPVAEVTPSLKEGKKKTHKLYGRDREEQQILE